MSVTWSSPVVTEWARITSALMGQSPVETVPACPVQIGAHHHIDVHTDINRGFCIIKISLIRLMLSSKVWTIERPKM